jgi:nucleoside 2-deoxyribosyltransferase
MKKIYIAGPITGREYGEAKLHFENAAAYCEEVLNMVPVNPMALVHAHDKEWISYMRVGIKAMMDCDALYMLDGFSASKGAQVELQLAMGLRIPIYFERASAKLVEVRCDSNVESLSILIADTNLSLRVKNCLKSIGVEYAYQLAAFSAGELLRYRNMGKGSVHEITRFCEEHGIKF